MADLSRVHMLAVHHLLRERRDRVPLSPTWRRIHQAFELGEPDGKQLRFDAEQHRLLREQARIAWGFDPLTGVPDGDQVTDNKSFLESAGTAASSPTPYPAPMPCWCPI